MSVRRQIFQTNSTSAEGSESDHPDERDLQLIEQGGGGTKVDPALRRSRASSALALTLAGTADNTRPFLAPGIIAAQRSIVGAILADNAMFELTSGVLEVSDFDDEVSKIVYEAITAILDGAVDGVTRADPVTISVQPGVQTKLSMDQLYSLAESADIDLSILTSHLTVVQTHAAERRLEAEMLKARGLMGEDLDIGSKRDGIIEIFSDAPEHRAVKSINIGDAAILALVRLAEAAKSGKPLIGVPSGYADLDALTAGFHDGQLIILAARPGMGKTAIALCIGLLAAAAGYPGVMVSMEMIAEELAKRAVSLVSGIDGQALRIGALTEAQWVLAAEAGEYLQTIPFEVVDTPGIKFAMVAKYCRQLVRKKKLKLLMIDYLQIMMPMNAGVIREQQIAMLSRGFKLLARELGIPIILLSQLNRSVDARVSKRPMLSDLRESGSLEQDADTVMFVHREGEKADVIVEKQRSGPVGDVRLIYTPATTAFMNPKQESFFPTKLLKAA